MNSIKQDIQAIYNSIMELEITDYQRDMLIDKLLDLKFLLNPYINMEDKE